MIEWVLAAYIGAAQTLSAPISLTQAPIGTDLTLRDINFAGRSFAPPLYYGYRFTYFPSPAAPIGVEAEMIHLKVFTDTGAVVRVTGTHRNSPVNGTIPVSNVVQQLSISHGLNLLLANVVARRTLVRRSDARPRIQAVARLGAGPTLPHAESTIDGLSHEGYELGALALQAAAGVEWRLYRGFAAAAEYKFTRTRQNVTVARGEAHGVFASHHLVFGATWHSK